MLSTKARKEVYVEPVIEGDSYPFTVKVGKPKNVEAAKNGTKLSRGANFQCVMSGTPIAPDYIKTEGKSGRMGARLMAIVAEGESGRVYLSPMPEHEAAALKANPEWTPELMISSSTQYLGVMPYGMEQFSQLFTDRQIVALMTFSDFVQELCESVKRDALVAGPTDDGLADTNATAYSAAIQVYLAFSLSKCADYWNTSTTWMLRGTVGHLFTQQAIPMTWDYPEANQFSVFHCAWHEAFGWVSKAIETLSVTIHGVAQQSDAAV